MDRNRIKGKLKETEGRLTGDPLREMQGKGEGFLGKLRERAQRRKRELEERRARKTGAGSR